jgi:Domain of unknown function (DUF4129)
LVACATFSPEPSARPAPAHGPLLRKRRAACVALFAVCAAAALARPAAAAPRPAAPLLSVPAAPGPLDLPRFTAELRSLQLPLQSPNLTPRDLTALLSRIPSHWQVQDSDRQFTISAEPIRVLLQHAADNPDAASRKNQIAQALDSLADLADQIDGYTAVGPAASGDLQARQKLNRILARSDFAGRYSRTAAEIWRQKVADWLLHFIEKLFAGMVRHPIGGKILLWTIIVGSVLLLAFALFRIWITRDRADSLKLGPPGIPSRSWQQWVHAARLAADRGDFREAVHNSYWAAVARLADLGALPADSTRTPREFLLLLRRPRLPSAASADPRPPLLALTRRLERVWYGFAPATAEDFRDSLRQLEMLGCPLS